MWTHAPVERVFFAHIHSRAGDTRTSNTGVSRLVGQGSNSSTSSLHLISIHAHPTGKRLRPPRSERRATRRDEREQETREQTARSRDERRENERKSEKTHFENTFRSKFGYSGYLLSLSPLQNLRNTCRFFLRAFSYKTDKTFAVLRFAYILYKQGKHSGI